MLKVVLFVNGRVSGRGSIRSNISSSKSSEDETIPVASSMKMVMGWQRKLVDLKVAFHILKLALKNYRSFKRSVNVVKALYLFKKSILGGIETKLVKLNGKIYHSIYAPGYPSKAFDNYIEAELNRIVPVRKKTNDLTFIFFAITTKCPLKCEHCLEWNNLNKKENFTIGELHKVVARFQKEGIAQFHFSGGEPMVRVKDLVQVIDLAGKDSEFYVLTSGFNFTAKNARTLKRAGLTGVVISLDHYDAEMHNAFRGFNNSCEDVINAIRNAQAQNLLVTLTVCATQEFTTWNNLLKYAELAKSLGVAFIQILEPKAVGHYESKDVLLDASHFKLLDKFYETLNFYPDFKNYPVILYHGFYQRRVGCLSGGNRTLYIDSEGFVNSCPFCHNKSYNIRDDIKSKEGNDDVTMKPGCTQYGSA